MQFKWNSFELDANFTCMRFAFCDSILNNSVDHALNSAITANDIDEVPLANWFFAGGFQTLKQRRSGFRSSGERLSEFRTSHGKQVACA